MKVKVNAAAENTHTAAGTRAAYLADAKSKLSPLLDQGKDRLTPLATDAREKGAQYAQQAADALAPTIAVAKERARGGYEDIVPKLSDALENLVNNPNAQEAQSRGIAAVQALRGEIGLSKGEQKKLQKAQLEQIKALRKSATPAKTKKKGSPFFVILALGLLGAAGYFLWKKFMAPSDSDWQSASAYEPTKSADKPAASSQSFGEPVDAPANEQAAPPVDRTKYNEDAYVGAEPPAGFTIKGNERSMKYHTAGSGGYERTIADVWFTSEEAAEKAGFSRAQR
ncbi:hypothetical protein CGZ93_02605 [Enemella dayhoffiae]|uniref:Uncharacterized protein n=1 Tax=Enemella dayhoffiae TaxID=2016507 RepID=A0A255HAD1_9ACTN|nr:hypothetical protein [Enemella dayhoffiae]OYO24611.1 hypothetical protein CGZ93_02605 [Enemella dayhoffiae]